MLHASPGQLGSKISFKATVRGRWGVENQQHRVSGVQFREGARWARNDCSAENLALIRRMASNVLRHDDPPRDSIRRRKFRVAPNDDYRSRLLSGTPIPPLPTAIALLKWYEIAKF